MPFKFGEQLIYDKYKVTYIGPRPNSVYVLILYNKELVGFGWLATSVASEYRSLRNRAACTGRERGFYWVPKASLRRP